MAQLSFVRRARLVLLVAVLAAAGPARPVSGQGPASAGGALAIATPDAVLAGELVIEPPTLINLGFEWFIQGDANRNATVAVSFRKTGSPEWLPALPP